MVHNIQPALRKDQLSLLYGFKASNSIDYFKVLREIFLKINST